MELSQSLIAVHLQAAADVEDCDRKSGVTEIAEAEIADVLSEFGKALEIKRIFPVTREGET